MSIEYQYNLNGTGWNNFSNNEIEYNSNTIPMLKIRYKNNIMCEYTVNING